MGVADTLGLAGGAGGVNHVGQVVALQVQPRCMTRPTVEVEGVHGDDTDTHRCRQALQQLTLGQQQRHAAVFEHVGQALGRVIRVQRHIGATGLDDRQHADQQLRRSLDGNRHTDVRPHAFVAQVMGQAVGLGVQLGVAQLPALPHQGDALRGQARLLVEQLR
ncbi:hypothetical protein D3C84_361470 [compost metagenome]